MIKSLRAAILIWVAAAFMAAAGTTPVNYTQTNVLQNVNLQLTIYQQGATNGNGTRVADQVTSYSTKNLITNLAAATGQQFGAGAKLVLSTIYSNVTVTTGSASYSNVLSTNLPLAVNSTLNIGVFNLSASLYGGSVVIDGNNINGFGSATTDVIIDTTGASVQSVTIDTNVGYITTLTPSTDTDGILTNVLIETEFQTVPAPTETVFTNVSSSIDILYGGSANALYPVTNFLTFSANPPVVVVETGNGLDTTNALTVANLASQTGLSLQTLNINYSYATPSGASNALTLDLQGFVKQTLKVDTLYSHGTNKVIEDIFGGTANWNVFGAGFTGVTNAVPVVAEGSVTVSFLKNLSQ